MKLKIKFNAKDLVRRWSSTAAFKHNLIPRNLDKNHSYSVSLDWAETKNDHHWPSWRDERTYLITDIWCRIKEKERYVVVNNCRLYSLEQALCRKNLLWRSILGYWIPNNKRIKVKSIFIIGLGCLHVVSNPRIKF